MKRPIAILIACVLLLTMARADEAILHLLKSESWQDRDKAVSEVSANLEKYKSDEDVKKAVLQALRDENETYAHEFRTNSFTDREGRGEYYLFLCELVVNLNIQGSTGALLDCADNGLTYQDALIVNLMSEDPSDLSTMVLIGERLSSQDVYYKYMRSSLMSLLSRYLDKTGGAILPARKTMIKEMVRPELDLSRNDSWTTLYAVQCSKYFMDDKGIVVQVRKIAEEKTYSLRNEAEKPNVLRADQERRLRQEAQKVLDESAAGK